tara:strand:+ start:303 stop:1004 length:702 start_codon:yes stop_codon:yes gene_type:complete
MIVFFIGAARADDAANRISSMIEEIDPATRVISVKQSPINNIMEVKISSGEYIYVTKDTKFIFSGELLRNTEAGVTNITEQRLSASRKELIEKIDLDKAISFSAEGKETSEVFVFTDVSCAYCKRFHQHIDEINKNGITVHYLAFPRAGMDSPAAQLMSDVWCAQNPQLSLTNAKKEEPVKDSKSLCNSPVAEQLGLGLALGMNGTPGIYDSDGRHLGGYLTATQLNKALNHK